MLKLLKTSSEYWLQRSVLRLLAIQIIVKFAYIANKSYYLDKHTMQAS